MNTPDFGSLWPLDKSRLFEITACEKSSYIVETGTNFQVNGRIRNNSQDWQTAYLVIKLAYAGNEHADVVFDSDRDFLPGQKEALRFVDIPPEGEMEFSVNVPVNTGLPRGTVDMRLELWSPGRLRYPAQAIETVALFYRSLWGNGVDIIYPEDLIAKIFISYSWQSPEHIKWVNNLAQELARRQIRVVLDQKDLEFGQEVTSFMERGVKLPVCVVICSSSYTKKANERDIKMSGVGSEVSLLTSQILNGRVKATVIPVIRDNDTRKIPDFLHSALYVDMDVENWRAKPLTDLANQIIKYAKV